MLFRQSSMIGLIVLILVGCQAKDPDSALPPAVVTPLEQSSARKPTPSVGTPHPIESVPLTEAKGLEARWCAPGPQLDACVYWDLPTNLNPGKVKLQTDPTVAVNVVAVGSRVYALPESTWAPGPNRISGTVELASGTSAILAEMAFDRPAAPSGEEILARSLQRLRASRLVQVTSQKGTSSGQVLTWLGDLVPIEKMSSLQLEAPESMSLYWSNDPVYGAARIETGGEPPLDLVWLNGKVWTRKAPDPTRFVQSETPTSPGLLDMDVLSPLTRVSEAWVLGEEILDGRVTTVLAVSFSNQIPEFVEQGRIWVEQGSDLPLRVLVLQTVVDSRRLFFTHVSRSSFTYQKDWEMPGAIGTFLASQGIE